eukprot:TRINITY_DN36253_c0_g1_i1.p1 TRINITY_DN36253_c0_g1~~TRINITY_DN36253_c0_g1_i1.p1  ORF type:complete len:282 (-),score=48.75 TRINITY_DN36253_c0_g1_i1:302-1147(-)
MYMFCCWARSNEEYSHGAQNSTARLGRFAGKELKGQSGKSSDTEKFDKAADKNDVAALVSLLSSSEPIEVQEQLHPWASNPRTIGALSATHLAKLGQGIHKDQIREAGAIPKLVKWLATNDADRVQTAVVTLSFLTADCPKNAVAAYDTGAMPALMRHMDADVPGMRAAAATTLRNICIEKDAYRKKFVALGGLTALVKQLDCSANGFQEHADTQLEAVLNLQDMIEAEDGVLIPEYAEMAISAGAEKKLMRLLVSDDSELRNSVQELLDCLATVKEGTRR